MNLSTVFPGASPKALRKTVVLALILALAAHGFCFFNLTYSGESVMLNAAKGSASQIASGAFLMPLYWRVRGAISAPLWVGLLSSCYLSLTVVLLCGLARPRFALSDCDACGFGRAFAVRALHLCRVDSHPPNAAFLAFLLASCARCLLSARARGHTAGRAASGRRSGAGSFISLLLSRRIGDLSDSVPAESGRIRALSRRPHPPHSALHRARHGGVSGRLYAVPPPRRT